MPKKKLRPRQQDMRLLCGSKDLETLQLQRHSQYRSKYVRNWLDMWKMIY